MKLLRLANTVNSTSAPYNQFSLGLKQTIDQTFCSLFEHDILIDREIKGFHGNGSILRMIIIIKKLINHNNYDVIHIHSGLTGIIFMIAAFPFKLHLFNKVVFTLHNSWNVLKLRNQILNFFVMLASKKICTCGISSRDSLPSLITLFVGKKTEAIVNGFDHARIDRVENNSLDVSHFENDSKVKIVCVGALNKTKNQIALLEALKVSNVEGEVIFLGDGVNRENLTNFSKNISNSLSINFKGRVSRDLAIEHMLEADVSISLSNGEGLPIAVLESMYAGCFTILSSIPPHKEISPPSQRNLFVNTSNKLEIINSLNYLKDNIQKIQAGRADSKDYSITYFSVNNMLRGYKRVYNSI